MQDFAPDVGNGPEGTSASKTLKLRQYDFTIQFCWRPQPRDQRLKKQAQQGGVVPGTAATQDEPSPATNHST